MSGEAQSDEFVEEHEPFVRDLAGRVRRELSLSTDLEELTAYGFRGLVEARSRFDPSRGVKFSTFAYYRVRGAILDGVRKMGYLPRRIHARRAAAEALDRSAREVATQRDTSGGAPPDVGQTLAAVDEILGKTCAAYIISLVGQSPDQADPDPEALTILDEDRSRVRAALDVLSERERTLIEGHYFEDRTLEEVGAELGISKSWASRLTSRALGRLREHLGD